MTIRELRGKLPTMVIWMAQEAVMEGVAAYHKSQEQYNIEKQKEQAGETYNYILAHAYYEGVRVAAEVLWKLFASCSMECQKAIEEVAKSKDGYFGDPGSYFGAFVAALEKIQGHPVRIREVE